MRRHAWAVRAGLLLAVLAWAVAAPPEVEASGPGTGGRRVRLEDAPAGPYRLRALTSPTPPRIENLYLEVRVSDGVSRAVLTDVTVWVTAEPVEGGAPPIEVQATHDIAPVPGEYAAHLPVAASGVWQVTIVVDGPPGSGQASFLERVARPTSLGGWVAIGAPLGGLLALGVLFWWLQRSGRVRGGETNASGEQPPEADREPGPG